MELNILNSLITSAVGQLFEDEIYYGQNQETPFRMYTPKLIIQECQDNDDTTQSSFLSKSSTKTNGSSNVFQVDKNIFAGNFMEQKNNGLQNNQFQVQSNNKDNLFQKNQSPKQQNFIQKQSQNTNKINNNSNLDQSQNIDNKSTVRREILWTPEIWIQQQGPLKLQESLQRLQLDLSVVTKKDLEKKTYEQLLDEKKKVKNELKYYDNCYSEIFGRYPMRDEKEPLRPLYIYYKKIRQFITLYENKQNQQSSNQETNPIIKNNQIEIKNNELQIDQLKKELSELNNVRNVLRDKLHNFQIEFAKANNRRIKFQKDIQPVQDEYKNYKEIKQKIQQIEFKLQSLGVNI